MQHRFPFAAILGVLVALPAAPAREEDQPGGLKAMNHLVGVWSTVATNKPAKWRPDGARRTVQENTMRILKDRLILGREVSQPDGVKSLWLLTHDAKTNAYPFWIFNNRGLLGGEWSSTWDEATRTFTSKATDTPKGWTSSGKYHFPDKSTELAAFWIKDDTGTLLLEEEAKKTRQPDSAGARVLAAWSRLDKPAEPLPPELKILERLLGSWEAVAVSKPALWTPQEVRTTSKITRKWVLDGQFLQDSAEVSDGQEGLSLLTFDPRRKKYRSWWFSSEGHHNKAVGEWNETTESLSFKAELDDGLVARSSVRFFNKDRHVWKVEIKDGNGKLYLDTEWTVTRRKE